MKTGMKALMQYCDIYDDSLILEPGEKNRATVCREETVLCIGPVSDNPLITSKVQSYFSGNIVHVSIWEGHDQRKCNITLESRNFMRSQKLHKIMYQDLWHGRKSLPDDSTASVLSTLYFHYSIHTSWNILQQENGIETHKNDGHYLFISWNEAEKHCQSLSSHLAIN